MIAASTMKASLNSACGANSARAAPAATPATIGTIQMRSTSGSTAPRARCAW